MPPTPRELVAGPCIGAGAGGFPVTRTPAGVVRAAGGTRDLAVLDARLSIAVYTVVALIWLVPDRRLERTIRQSGERVP